MTRRLAIAALMVLGVGAAHAAGSTATEPWAGGIACRHSAAVVARCFTIHGRLSPYNGNLALRIWQVGTKRMFGVLDRTGADPEDPSLVMPPSVDGLLRSQGLDGKVYGDYEVCPLTVSRPDAMQMVCIADATHLKAEQP